MRKLILVILLCGLVFPSMGLGQTVKGVASCTWTTAQVDVTVDTPSPDALRSFGVRIIYDPAVLTYTGGTVDSIWNVQAAVEDVVDGSNRAVILLGGKLDTGNPGDKISGIDQPLGSVTFSKAAGAVVELGMLSLALGKSAPYDNFVDSTVLDLVSVSFDSISSALPCDGGVPVPDVVDVEKTTACSAITAVGLVCDDTTVVSSETIAKDNVISSDPIAGTSVEPGSTVVLVISSGPAVIPGDCNQDGVVNVLDLKEVRTQMGNPSAYPGCDCNDDDVVNAIDFKCIQTQM